MALGATTAAVVRLILGHAVRMATVGAALGLISAYVVLKGLTVLVRMQNVSLLNGWAFIAGATLIVAACAVAAVAPARRAIRVNPSDTLRADA